VPDRVSGVREGAVSLQGGQLGLFGGEEPPMPAPKPEAKPDPPRQPAAAVSAERALRALQRPLAVVASTDPDPPGLEGWREWLAEPPPQIVGGVCSEMAERRRPDGSLAPCPRLSCPHHLAIDRGEVVTVGRYREADLVLSTAGLPVEIGRRPALPAVPETQGEIDAFAAAVLDRLAELPETCTLEVVARYPDGAPIEEIERVLGVSGEMARRDLLRAQAKLFDPASADATANLEAVAPTRRKARPPRQRRTAADPPPAPRAIVRRETEAPPVREPSAGEIFTF
jgi:hypothetical protein